MTHEQHGSALSFADVLHFADGFLLEFGVADGEDFVDDEDFGVEVGGDGETQPHHHAAAVTLHRGVDIAFAAAEVDYLVELAVNLVAFHAEDAAVHVDVFAAGEFRVEAGAYLEERGYAATGVDAAGGGGGDAAEELEQGALAGAVLADDAEDIAFLYIEADVLEGIDVVGITLRGSVVGLADLEVGVFFVAHAGEPPAVQVVGYCAGADGAEAVELADVFETDYGLEHDFVIESRKRQLFDKKHYCVYKISDKG